MTKRDLVLLALSPAAGDVHSPVQVQKLIFLLDTELRSVMGGPHFRFKPYHYGPFDAAVYGVLNELASEGLVEVGFETPWRTYRLSDAGQKKGDALLKGLDPQVKKYISTVSGFVRGSTFVELLSAIYERYPAMAKKSVFRKPA